MALLFQKIVSYDRYYLTDI